MLDALDGVGLRGDGRLIQLNSYENRVFQVFLEDGRVVVTKFYRPGRWSDAQIAEEHAFAAELATDEVPVVAPLEVLGHTLHRHGDFLFSVSPRRGGRRPGGGGKPPPESIHPQRLPGRDLGFLLSQRGMFSYTGLSAAQVDRLREEHAVYLLRSGRLCVAGLNNGNVDRTAQAMAAVLDTARLTLVTTRCRGCPRA